MARAAKRNTLEQMIDLYASMDAEERALAKAALAGADRVLSRGAVKLAPAVQQGFDELGAEIAEGVRQ